MKIDALPYVIQSGQISSLPLPCPTQNQNTLVLCLALCRVDQTVHFTSLQADCGIGACHCLLALLVQQFLAKASSVGALLKPVLNHLCSSPTLFSLYIGPQWPAFAERVGHRAFHRQGGFHPVNVPQYIVHTQLSYHAMPCCLNLCVACHH